MITHQPRRILEASQHIRARQRRIFLQDLLDRIARAKKFENGLGRNACAPDNGTAVADGGLNDDSFVHDFKITNLGGEAS
jgi:hypothetical protein